MARRLALVIAAGAGCTLLLGGPASASGGGCHSMPTEGRGTEVVMSEMCFEPTVLHVPVGETVTWTNADWKEWRLAHNVNGASMTWGGMEPLRGRAPLEHTFSRPGIYPYACSLHVGMVGAVVVGDAGDPPGTIAATGSGGSLEAASAAARTPAGDRDDTSPALVAVVAVLAASAGYALGRKGAS